MFYKCFYVTGQVSIFSYYGILDHVYRLSLLLYDSLEFRHFRCVCINVSVNFNHKIFFFLEQSITTYLYLIFQDLCPKIFSLMNSLMNRTEIFSRCLNSDLAVYIHNLGRYFFLVQPFSQSLYILIQYLEFCLIELINYLVFISVKRLLYHRIILW